MSVIPAGTHVFVRSDLRSFALTGASVQEFLRRAVPLLDGTHDREDLIAAFPDYGRDGVHALLDHLQQVGVVEPAADTASPDSLAAFLGSWGSRAGDQRAALARAHVVVLGNTGWAAATRRELAGCGIGRITFLEVTELLAEAQGGDGSRHAGGTGETPAGPPRVGRHPADRPFAGQGPAGPPSGSLRLPDGDIALLVVAVHPDQLSLLAAAARAAEARRIRSLVAHVEGLSAIVGPIVVPGETACWECLRRRQLANQANFEESALLQSQLLGGADVTRLPLTLPGAAAVVGGLIAIEAVKLLSGYAPSQLVGRQLELNLVTHAARLHDLVRLPWCPVCGGVASAQGEGAAADTLLAGELRSGSFSPAEVPSGDLSTSRDPAELRTRLAGWVDDRNGIVRQLALNDPSPEQPHCLSTATAIVAAAAVPGHRHGEPLIGSGKGTTKVAAMVGAVGEAIERYSASLYRESDLLRASPKQLGEQALDPAKLCLYRPEQYAQSGFPYDRYDPAREISWTSAVWLDSGEPVLVPALATFFDYRARKGEQFCQVTSNGLAAGATLEDAALRATLELIERDAFMMTWLLRRSPRPLQVGDELGVDVQEVLVEMRALGMDAKLYLMRGDVDIPAVMCIAWGDGRKRPAATVALAAHADPVEAARRAVLEQAHVGPYVARLMADSTQRLPRTAAGVRSLNDHALYYVPRQRLRAFDFIRAARGAVRLDSLQPPRGSYRDACVAALARAGMRVAVADVTAPDVRLGPFRVARALGTYLQPIDFGHRLRRLANPRLGAHVNPDPHPLA